MSRKQNLIISRKSLKYGLSSVFFGLLFSVCGMIFGQEERYDLWPGLAPGETEKAANQESSPGSAQRVTNPYLLVFRPQEKKSDTCLLLFPGGGYSSCFYGNEGFPNAQYWNEKGITAIVLVYRVPRAPGKEYYRPAWQDAQRAIRFVRANAETFGINPDKIGVQGFSAGAHLTLLSALNSQTPAYEPIDDLDKVPCHLNFAIPIYPPYVLDDGDGEPNSRKGNDASMLDTFRFDEKTPPLCLIHGDDDIYSPMASVQLYHKLRTMNIPCELHIYAKTIHGFMFWNDLENARTWQDRCFAWLKTMELY